MLKLVNFRFVEACIDLVADRQCALECGEKETAGCGDPRTLFLHTFDPTGAKASQLQNPPANLKSCRRPLSLASANAVPAPIILARSMRSSQMS